ncbi:hypothetical protein HMPREF1144_5438 [Klebsiella sp. OBRC7]|nr:hypothetical protein CSC12_4444 [Klebsiella michiganensis]EJU30620.1 hypothetical protein HMPREF1144_5438 [Klebsiella sp. OBRC7]
MFYASSLHYAEGTLTIDFYDCKSASDDCFMLILLLDIFICVVC